MRILIVEDDRDIADFVKKALKGESHAVDIATDGIAGERLASTEPYDLIILDIMLPKKEGIAVLKSLRQAEIQTPVLVLTARGEVPDRVAGLDAGADDYIKKPFALAELRARVRALLRRHSEERSPLLQVGTLTLDSTAHEITVKGQPVELTNREYAILEYLLRNKNRLLSKGMIADHVWDYHYKSGPNLIEVYIRKIRQKIAHHSKQTFIQTVRGGGYIIRDD
jgi:two-component system copper resistance phosphate regulon response regulator CusR